MRNSDAVWDAARVLPTGAIQQIWKSALRGCCGRGRPRSVIVHSRTEGVGRDFAFPAADGDGGYAVADEVGEGATFAHEAVDADEEGEGFDGDHRHGGEGRGQGDEAGAGDAARAFRGDHRDEEELELLAEGQGNIRGLREEDRRHGHVDVGAVEVEAVAGGNDEASRGA